MPNFQDIKLKEYIYFPRFRNINFAEYIDQKHDYSVADIDSISSAEKSIFSYNDLGEISKSEGKYWLDFIFEVESKLLEVLAKMEFQWVNINQDKLKKIWIEINKRTELLEQEIYDLVWEKFNINSAKQVQEILFDKLKLPQAKKIKTGFSVDNEVLSELWKKYPIANIILEYRGLKKLQNTYVDGLLKFVNSKTFKIHTTYNQTQTTTGRLSSENPNLQNIPSGDGFSNEIKSCFIPSSQDFEFLVMDYSQVELRILANLSRDIILLEAFKNNEDIHQKTAKFLFWEDIIITSDLRRKAKTVNFGVIYGISGFGLSKNINSSPVEANSYIEKFYEKYNWVKIYYEELLKKARETGYVETYFGRRRYISWLNDSNKILRSQAEREAINMPIQWTSADIIKLAMIKIDEFLKKWNYKTKMIMQVHDELVFEVHKSEIELMKKEIKNIMENIISFEAKLFVDLWMGKNWTEAKK